MHVIQCVQLDIVIKWIKKTFKNGLKIKYPEKKCLKMPLVPVVSNKNVSIFVNIKLDCAKGCGSVFAILIAMNLKSLYIFFKQKNNSHWNDILLLEMLFISLNPFPISSVTVKTVRHQYNTLSGYVNPPGQLPNFWQKTPFILDISPNKKHFHQ